MVPFTVLPLTEPPVIGSTTVTPPGTVMVVPGMRDICTVKTCVKTKGRAWAKTEVDSSVMVDARKQVVKRISAENALVLDERWVCRNAARQVRRVM